MALPRILIVDDIWLFQEIMIGYLSKSPVSVVTAANGREAMEAIRVNPPDLIYMDLHMPEMDGATCCRTIKNDPLLRSIPVIMMIAAGKESDRQRCLASGCDAVITKPIERAEFLRLGRSLVPAIDRREDRHPCRTTVVFKDDLGTAYGTGHDISSRGVYVATDRPLLRNEQILVHVVLPDGPADLIEARGRVAWSNCGPNRPKPALPDGFGIEFREMAADSVSLLRGYLGRINLAQS